MFIVQCLKCFNPATVPADVSINNSKTPPPKRNYADGLKLKIRYLIFKKNQQQR